MFFKYEVAVIIPTLNEELYIEKCIDSIKTQTYPFEKMDVMIIDGGSKDRTRDIVTEISKIEPNVRLINNPGKIQSVAFNIGVKNSDAPIVIRLDAHALYDRRYVEVCVKNATNVANYEYGNVGGKCTISRQHESVIADANVILNRMRFGIGGASFRVANEKDDTVDSVPFGCFRREVIDKVGLMNEALPRGEDNEYNYRIRAAGYKILFDPSIKCTYFARNTYSGSVKQMYANGFSIGVLLHQCRKSVGLRHLVPLLFVLSIVLLSIGAIFTKYLFYLLLLELTLYAILNTVSSIVNCIGKNWKLYFVLPVLILSVHIAYGVGSIIGLIKKKY